jgi:hypothetical protein
VSNKPEKRISIMPSCAKTRSKRLSTWHTKVDDFKLGDLVLNGTPEMKIRESMGSLTIYGWDRSRLQHTVEVMPTYYKRLMETSLEEGL